MGGVAAVAAISQGAQAAKNLYDLHKAKKQTKKELSDIRMQQYMERKKALNLLEESMASKRAKLSSAGVINSSSALAAAKRYRTDAYNDMAQNDLSYNSRARNVLNKYRNKRDDYVLEQSFGATGQILK